MPYRVPDLNPVKISSTAFCKATRSFFEIAYALVSVALRKSWTAITYHKLASIELYSGVPPLSGKRLGNIPSDTTPAHSKRIWLASFKRSPARHSPRMEINVSRPQSVNH